MNLAHSVIKTGLQAQDAQLAIIAHNMANMSTVGFKRDRAVFQDLFYQIEQPPATTGQDGVPASSGIQRGTGTRLVGTQKVFTEGNAILTHQPLDVAIRGSGFLQVQMNNGEVGYTRDGQLRRNQDGQLTTMQGQLLIPEITLPVEAKSISIHENGTVWVTLPGVTEPNEVGQLSLASFANPAGLLALGANLFKETISSGVPIVGNPGEDGLGILKSGELEGSNVQAVEQMVDLMMAQRTYEMSTKVLSGADTMLQYLAQSVR